MALVFDSVRRGFQRVVGIVAGAEDLEEISLKNPAPVLEKMYLVIYGPYGSLPSFDPDCLTAICWFRICNIPINLEASNESDMSPDGKLPFIMMTGGQTYKWTELRKLAQPPPFWHKDARPSEILEEVGTILETTIRPAILYTLWFDPSIRECISHNYGRNYPWPLNYYLLWRDRCRIRRIVTPSPQKITDALLGLKRLTEILSDAPYFAGSHPGWEDAVAYGLLTVALTLFNPTNELRTMIDTCPGLGSLVDNMRRTYFDSQTK